MIRLLYCPACDSTPGISHTGVCIQCGGAVVDLTQFVQAAEKRALAKVRIWAIEQRDICQRMQANEVNDRDWCTWNGSETSLNALITWLDNGMDSEGQS